MNNMFNRKGGEAINENVEELRTGGDGYFDVLEINEDIWGRELHHRSTKNQ